MELLLSSGIGLLTAVGIYLVLRARTFDLVLGLTLLSYAVNLFIFASGRLVIGKAPIISTTITPTLANFADPLPQALVLTAIVIGFAMTAVLLVLSVRGYADHGTDQVDGREPRA
ncbi:MAG: Na+/H+ antiporter subunit C [Pseudomonadales bacterium]|nr:Na+/H+ antiporter subunit C [Pseudomonadales bacterium]